MKGIIKRIEREAGAPNITETLGERLDPTDLQSLLLEIYRRQVKRRNPQRVFADYVSGRFTRPSTLNPSVLLEWERAALSYLPKDFEAIELSPVCPLGTVSSLAPINQDWVLTTIRNSEVLSDPTNVLALECAFRRKKLALHEPKNASTVNLACSQRVVRTQRYKGTKALQHFRLYSLCSAGRDVGNHRFEIQAVNDHVMFYIRSLRNFLGRDTRIKITLQLRDHNESEPWLVTDLESLQKNCDISTQVGRTPLEAKYYRTFRFHIYASRKKGEEVEMVDGGDTGWTQRLLGNSKERVVISAIGTDRVCGLRDHVLGFE